MSDGTFVNLRVQVSYSYPCRRPKYAILKEILVVDETWSSPIKIAVWGQQAMKYENILVKGVTVEINDV